MFKVALMERPGEIRRSQASGVVRIQADRMENMLGHLNFYRGGSLVFVVAAGTWTLAEVEGAVDEPGKSVAGPFQTTE